METATARMIERKTFTVLKYFVAARLRAFTRWSSRLRGANRRFDFDKRRQPFIRPHNEPLTVVAMRVCNPDLSPASMIPLPKCCCFGTILVMNTFTLFPPHKGTERPQTNRPDSSFVPGPSDRAFVPTQSGAVLSRGVLIKGSVKFLNELCIDGEVEGTIDSHGTLVIGEHARIRGEIRTKSVNVRGKVEGNIFVTERCELQAGSTVRGDIEAPRLTVDENATFCGSAKVGTGKSLPA